MQNSFYDDVLESFEEHLKLIEVLKSELVYDLEKVADLFVDAINSGNVIFWCGNGGSASDSQHMAAEFVGRFKKNRIPLNSYSLSSDVSVLTCIANDFGFEQVFSRQIKAHAKEGDILIAISTSGSSLNIKEAISVANTLKLKTIALLGKDGGDCLEIAQIPIHVKSHSTARIQEAHILLGHILCELTEKKLGF